MQANQSSGSGKNPYEKLAEEMEKNKKVDAAKLASKHLLSGSCADTGEKKMPPPTDAPRVLDEPTNVFKRLLMATFLQIKLSSNYNYVLVSDLISNN